MHTDSPVPDRDARHMAALEHVVAGCTSCGACTADCLFLQTRGTPGKVAEAVREGRLARSVAYECSLCGLCDTVCPEHLEISRMFLDVRRAWARVHGAPKAVGPLLAYEQLGRSWLVRHEFIPHGCTTVFFPGCSLPGAYPPSVRGTYERLRRDIPALGVVLDCCSKPSHDQGLQETFEKQFRQLRDRLLSRGVRRILTACPNCHRIFATYGAPLETVSVYEVLAAGHGDAAQGAGAEANEAVIHDPCGARRSKDMQSAVRTLVRASGFEPAACGHTGARSICCGEGAGVGYHAPAMSADWQARRVPLDGGRKVITYCCGCVNSLAPSTDIEHVLALGDERAGSRARRPASSLVRWMRRLGVKAELMGMGLRTGGSTRLLLGLLVIAIGVAAAQISGVSRYFDPQVLKGLVETAGPLAPALFVAVCALAPVLFLPAWPLALAAGLLFGPVWGVVYALSGATVGAALSFAVARYFLRGWVSSRLTGPKWRALDERVEREGWKIVAVTRLVPLFPFNLLNYAFGLTGVRFVPYIVASAVFMAPGSIAYVVTASSLPRLLAGAVTWEATVGLGVFAVLSLLAVWYRRSRAGARLHNGQT